MATQATQNFETTGQSAGLSAMLSALADAEGSRNHRYLDTDSLSVGRNAARNLADVVHYLCTLHGRHPGVIDHAGTHTVHPAARDWLKGAAMGFAFERKFLTQLVVAAGPLPSTPGQAECESAVIGQRHALDMLATSDRTGCSFGAATALVLDWQAIRTVLDKAAQRLGVEAPDCALPTFDSTLDVALHVADSQPVERALIFGAQQLFGQHRGLWDLIEARQIARGDH